MLRMIDLTTLLTWLVMLGNAGVIILFGASIPSLPIHKQRRANLGIFAMVLVVAFVSGSLYFLTSRTPTNESQLSQYILPLATCILLASMYRLSFSPLLSPPTPPLVLPLVPHRLQPRRFFLFLLTLGAVIGVCGLVILDLFFV